MGKGGITRAEFIEGMQHKRRRSTDRSPETPKLKPAHIDLRVVRFASLDQGDKYEKEAWNDYINGLAQKNHVIGTGKPLGSIAITEFSAGRLNDGLREAYQNDYFDHRKKPKLFRKAKREIDDFLREKESHHQWKRSEEMVMAHDRRSMHKVCTLTNEFLPHDIDVDDDFDIEEEAGYYAFGQAYFETNGLEIHGRKYGINLTIDKDEILQEEFRELHRFIGKTVLKNTVSQSGNQPFHATVFRLHDYVGFPPLDQGRPGELIMPSSMVFEKPQTEMHTVAVE